jgi:sugar phosphate isomerase/epimerase
MIFALTTRWNAQRHETGESMLEEIISLGFSHVELGFDLTPNLVPGVLSMVASNSIKVDSLHAFCPLPSIVHFPHPEPFTLASPDPAIRANAIHYLQNTIHFATQVGARVVVAHGGNADVKPSFPKFVELILAGKREEPVYEEWRMKSIIAREKAATRQLPFLYAGVEKILPLLEETRVTLAFEILPTWEAFPSEVEMEKLLSHFNSPWLKGWHDFGHGQIRENLGFTNHLRWVTRLRPWLAGMHIHDVIPPHQDHIMPPAGTIDFTLFRETAQGDILRVLEPSHNLPAEAIVTGLKTIREAWAINDKE